MIELLKIAAVVIFLSALGVLAVWLQYRMEQREIGADVQEPVQIVFVKVKDPEKEES